MMTTLMRNGRSVRSEKNALCRAANQRELFNWDPIRGSHHGASGYGAATIGGIHDRTDHIAETSNSSCTAGVVHTWHRAESLGSSVPR